MRIRRVGKIACRSGIIGTESGGDLAHAVGSRDWTAWALRQRRSDSVCGRILGEAAYSVAVKGPVGRQNGCGGFPFAEHPLPVEMYVAPGRYGW